MKSNNNGVHREGVGGGTWTEPNREGGNGLFGKLNAVTTKNERAWRVGPVCCKAVLCSYFIRLTQLKATGFKSW